MIEPLDQYKDDLIELVKKHPEAEEKIGCGISYFFVGKAAYGTKCFFIKRLDGTSTDFSYITSVKAKSKTIKQSFIDALRLISTEQTRQFKKEAFKNGPVFCEISKQPLTLETCHVDHEYPNTFENIVRAFMSQVEWSERDISKPSDNQFVTTIVNEELAEKFRWYHEKSSNLRLLASSVNLSIGNRSHEMQP
jgi:hypothetical protein